MKTLLLTLAACSQMLASPGKKAVEHPPVLTDTQFWRLESRLGSSEGISSEERHALRVKMANDMLRLEVHCFYLVPALINSGLERESVRQAVKALQSEQERAIVLLHTRWWDQKSLEAEERLLKEDKCLLMRAEGLRCDDHYIDIRGYEYWTWPAQPVRDIGAAKPSSAIDRAANSLEESTK